MRIATERGRLAWTASSFACCDSDTGDHGSESFALVSATPPGLAGVSLPIPGLAPLACDYPAIVLWTNSYPSSLALALMDLIRTSR
jgi:hypothetical protein